MSWTAVPSDTHCFIIADSDHCQYSLYLPREAIQAMMYCQHINVIDQYINAVYENCIILTSTIFDWSTLVTDRQTDRQMYGTPGGRCSHCKSWLCWQFIDLLETVLRWYLGPLMDCHWRTVFSTFQCSTLNEGQSSIFIMPDVAATLVWLSCTTPVGLSVCVHTSLCYL